MKISNSVRKAIDDLQLGERESAMLHACNAVDGTAHKIYPRLGNKARFTRFLRENYLILGPMALPGLDLRETFFQVTVQGVTAPGGKPDIADVVYCIHRCCHGHGDELPEGFRLIPDVAGRARLTRTAVARGQLRLSDRIIPGLLAVVVLSPVNKNQFDNRLSGYWLSYSSNNATQKLLINEWWGRRKHFPEVLAKDPQLQIGGLDFTDIGSDLPPHNISLDQSTENPLLRFLDEILD
jgi:hypothetical protein